MNTRNIENRLAYIGALIVLIGVSAAAATAFAGDPVVDADTVATRDHGVHSTVTIARAAMKQAADEAAAALKAENAFDLDNQLADISSTLMAARK